MPNPKLHELKTWPAYFQSVVSGQKQFEVRQNDRDFQTGDAALLLEYDPAAGKFTGRISLHKIGYMLHGPAFGLETGFCVFGLEYADPHEFYNLLTPQLFRKLSEPAAV